MAVVVFAGEPMSRALAATAVARAERRMPSLGRTGRDVLIVTADCHGYDPRSRPADAGLVVMTGRASAVQAAVALLLGADAYLPLDLAPHETAAAIGRVARGELHIEPETAAALQALVALAGGLLPQPRSREVGLALGLRSRGWGWRQAVESADVDARLADDWLRRLVASARASTAGAPRPRP